MKTIAIDIESFSPIDLAKSGVYKYAADPGFRILLFSYSVDDGEVVTVDLEGGEEIPTEILEALADPTVTKWAYNAMFERVCLSNYLGEWLVPEGWRCSMIWAATLGLPGSLKDVARVLKLPEQKMEAGRDLIKLFSIPTKEETRNLPSQHPEEWELYKTYNARDVEVENAIRARLAKFPVPDYVWGQYWMDQRINDRGIRVDLGLARNARACGEEYRNRANQEAQDLTGLEKPTSPIQVKDWLAEHGCELENLDKNTVATALTTARGVVKRVLELRQDLSKSSVKKYDAMLNVAGTDQRARGLFQFYGANRTGRWAGRLIQLQNLPRNSLPDLDVARSLVKTGLFNALELLYPSVPETLSQLVRTAFIPSPGHRFIVADYSAIEARVLAWLAGQQSTLDAFRHGEDLYCATASAMFGVPVEKHGQNAELRQKGKIAVLACGYQGAVGALTKMGALEMGLAKSELGPIVDAWRAANPKIVQYWREVEKAARQAIQTRTPMRLRNIKFGVRSGILFITLPSGRKLAYVKPELGENRYGMPCINYWGMNQGHWKKQETYGGKLVENIVQATARDLLAEAITRIEQAGHRIVMHVHDEVVIDEPADAPTTVAGICRLMTTAPDWAKGLPLDADGYECSFYKKD